VSQQINLFNPIFRQQKKYFSAATMVQALGLILLGTVLLGAYTMYRSTRLAADAAAAHNQLAAAQTQMVQVSAAFPLPQKSPRLEAEIKAVEGELASLQKVSEVLQRRELGDTKGYAEYFRAFARQIVPGLWLTGINIHGAGAEIGLQGKALNPELVPAYIGKLRNEPVLKGKSFSTLEMGVPRQRVAAEKDGPAHESAAGYINFSLRSSGMAEPGSNAGEAQGK